MKCPVCNISLVMTERNNVEIDYCPECRGVWLDRGELDKIIERSTPDQGQRSVRPASTFRADEYNDQRSYKKKRRESFLGDLFDF